MVPLPVNGQTRGIFATPIEGRPKRANNQAAAWAEPLLRGKRRRYAENLPTLRLLAKKGEPSSLTGNGGMFNIQFPMFNQFSIVGRRPILEHSGIGH
jgi:hypothetical protein